MKRFTAIVLVAASLIAAYLYHSAHAQGINIACTYQQAARYASDNGATDPKQWGPEYIVIEDNGKGVKLVKWNVPGVAAPANAAAFVDSATAATWYRQAILDHSADKDQLDRKDRAIIAAIVGILNVKLDAKITEEEIKAAYDAAYKASLP